MEPVVHSVTLIYTRARAVEHPYYSICAKPPRIHLRAQMTTTIGYSYSSCLA